MNDDGDDSFGEDGDEDMMGDGSEITTQLAAAGWQHGVMFCFVLFSIFILYLEIGSDLIPYIHSLLTFLLCCQFLEYPPLVS